MLSETVNETQSNNSHFEGRIHCMPRCITLKTKNCVDTHSSLFIFQTIHYRPYIIN